MHRETVLVTGGAGFVGSHFTRHLNKVGVAVDVIDDLSSGRIDNLPQPSDGCAFYQGDVCDPSLMAERIRDATLVVHFASVVGIAHVMQDPFKAIRTNVDAVRLLGELCAKADTPFVYVSSSAVYHLMRAGSGAVCDESTMRHALGRHPASIYSVSKALGELICESYRRSDGLRCLILRPFNLIGVRQSSTYGMVVPTFIRCALRGLPLRIHGDGSQVRAFSDVRQAVELMWTAITRSDWAGVALNLATNDHVTSVLDLAHAVEHAVGRELPVQFVPYEEAYGPHFVDVDYRRPSLRALRNLIGDWIPTPLDETLQTILRSELDHDVAATESDGRTQLSLTSSPSPISVAG